MGLAVARIPPVSGGAPCAYTTREMLDPQKVIAAFHAHREPTFAACHEALELLKQDVAIWKHEHTDQGDVWLGWGGG